VQLTLTLHHIGLSLSNADLMGFGAEIPDGVRHAERRDGGGAHEIHDGDNDDGGLRMRTASTDYDDDDDERGAVPVHGQGAPHAALLAAEAARLELEAGLCECIHACMLVGNYAMQAERMET
jgi:hypothetical protein